MTTPTYDIDLLRRLWDEGVHIDEIARLVGCCRHHVYELRVKHGLPRRRRTAKYVDPTPEEIEQRAAYCREMRDRGTPIGGR